MHVVLDLDVVGENLQVIERDVAAEDDRVRVQIVLGHGRIDQVAALQPVPVQEQAAGERIRQRLHRDGVGPLDAVDAQGLQLRHLLCIERDGLARIARISDRQATQFIGKNADRVIEDRAGHDHVERIGGVEVFDAVEP